MRSAAKPKESKRGMSDDMAKTNGMSVGVLVSGVGRCEKSFFDGYIMFAC